ncbi:MAG: radical SAM protein [Firmicutes bacterium]|nr:radical SAM protein [Bacillota bacterium]
MEFVNPFRTGVVSVTGTACALKCAHCNGHYLRHMLTRDRWEQLDKNVIRSCLVSGGCDRNGKVPILESLDAVRELGKKFRLNIHPGLLDEDEARRLGEVASVVSFDFVVDDETIEEVYGLPGRGEDYVRTYIALRRYARVVPHICIGIKGGEVRGEFRSIDILHELGVDAIIFLVLIPTRGTRYESASPPELREVGRVFEYARQRFPGTPLYLGCMRPHGVYREKVDRLAIDAGLDRIVLPARGAVAYAESLGIDVAWREECCSF